MQPKRIIKQGIKSKLHTFSNFFKRLPTVTQYASPSTLVCMRVRGCNPSGHQLHVVRHCKTHTPFIF